ncbi:phage tail protein [Carnobacterium maltaromaticum]|uniref:phage tail protein n=1 Tax=Carnobacterium maltaromaticum TaxID=2751 RepID=UPI003B985BFF
MSFNGTITATVTADISEFQRNMNEVTRTARSSVSDATRAVNNSSRGLFSGISSAVRSAGSTIGSFGSSVGRTMVAPFSAAGGQIQRVISGIGQRIPQPFRTAFSTVGSVVSSGASAIGNGFMAVTRGAGNAAMSVSGGLVRAFSSMGASGSSVLSSLSNGFSRFKDSTIAPIAGLLKISALLGVIGGFGGVLTKAIGRVDSINIATQSITQMTGSSENAAKAIDAIKTATKGTPIALDSMTNATKGLVAAGMKVDTLPGVLKSVADSAFAVANGAESIDTIAGAFKGLQASGVATLEDLNRLFDQNIPVYSMLGNQMGKSTIEMKKFISDGLLSSADAVEMLTKGIQEGTSGVNDATMAMAGVAQTAGNSIKGSWANAMSALNRGVGSIVELFYGDAIGAISGFGDIVENSLGKLAKNEGFINGVKGVVQAIKDGMAIVSPVLKNIAVSVGDLIKSVIKALPVLQPAIGIVAGAFLAFGNVLASTIIPSITKIFDYISSNQEIFSSLAVGVLGAVAAFKAMKVIGTIINLIKGARTAMLLLNAAFLANPIGILIGLIAGLVAGLVYFFTQTEIGKKLWDKIWTGIKEITTNVVETLKSVWDSLVTKWNEIVTSVKAIWGTVSTFFIELWNDLSSKAVTAWNDLTSKVMAIVQPFIDIFVATWKGVSEGLSMVWAGIKEVAGGYWEIIKNVILAPVLLIFDLVTGNFTQLAIDAQAIWENIKAGASSIWNGMGKIITGVATAIWSYISGVFATMNQWVITLWNGLKATASSIWEGLKSAVTNTVTGIWNDIKGVWDSITKSTTDTFNGVKKDILDPLMSIDLFEIGADILRGLWNGIKSIGDDIGSLIKSIADKIPSGIRKFLGIHSPSRVMAELGVYTGQGLVNGMASMQKDITQQAALYADTVKMQDYDTNNVMTADARVLGGGVSSSLDRLSSDVQNSSLSDLVFNVVNEWDGEKVVSYVQNQSARSKRNITVLNGG